MSPASLSSFSSRRSAFFSRHLRGPQEARRLLVDVSQADLAGEMRLEVLFYGLAYSVEGFEDACVEMRRLLDEGVRVTVWDLSQEVEAAKEQGHDHFELLAEVTECDS